MKSYPTYNQKEVIFFDETAILGGKTIGSQELKSLSTYIITSIQENTLKEHIQETYHGFNSQVHKTLINNTGNNILDNTYIALKAYSEISQQEILDYYAGQKKLKKDIEEQKLQAYGRDIKVIDAPLFCFSYDDTVRVALNYIPGDKASKKDMINDIPKKRYEMTPIREKLASCLDNKLSVSQIVPANIKISPKELIITDIGKEIISAVKEMKKNKYV